MDVLTAILACSLHPDESLVRAVVHVQSAGHTFFVGDLTALESDDSARNAAGAEQLLDRVRQRGHRAAVGLMGVPVEWAEIYARGTKELWDSCANISVGTARLSEFDYECRKGAKKARRAASSTMSRTCVLRRYAKELGLPAEFIAEVLRRVAVEKAPARPLAPSGLDNGWASGFSGAPTPQPFRAAPALK